MPSVAWYRAFECTRGDDGLGHPHFHVWMLSPYLPGGHEASIGGIDRVSEWWTKAIVEAGGTPCESGGNYELHAVRGDASEIRRELLKKDGNAFKMRIGNSAGEQVFEYSDGWSTEDLEDVVLASRLYEALEGRRMTQAARRFLEARERGCTFCKCERCVRVTSYRSDAWYERDEARRVEEAYLAAERGSLGGSPEG